MRDGCAGHQKGTTKIRVKRSIPDLWSNCVKIRKWYRIVPSCIVDEDVETAERLNCCLDRGVTRGRIGLIEMNQKALSPFCLDLAA
jgi:hypothetical protein